MKEKWTVEIEVDVDTSSSSWDHVDGKHLFEIENNEQFVISGAEDGLHRHALMICEKLLDWKLVKREIVGEIAAPTTLDLLNQAEKKPAKAKLKQLITIEAFKKKVKVKAKALPPPKAKPRKAKRKSRW
jgi:hypothetical protein